MYDNGPSMSNIPIKLHWAGWETDTYRLGQHGWEVSADQNVMNQTIRFAIRHLKYNIRGFSEMDRLCYQELRYNRTFSDSGGYGIPELPIQLASDYRIIQHAPTTDFHPVETIPMYNVNPEVRELDDLALFKRLPQKTNQVYLREASLSEVLDFALSKQEPRQKEIRERLMHERRLAEVRQESEVRAQLRLVG